MSLTRTALLALCVPALFATAPLPTGESVLDRSVEAMGGKKAFAAKKSSLTRGVMEIQGMGMKMNLTLHAQAPHFFRMEMEIPGMGKVLQGFDGTHGWAFSAMQGPQLQSGEEREQTRQQAHFDKGNWRALYKSAKTLGTETVDGETCHKVEVTPHTGHPQTQFFSTKSGLLVKTVAKVKTAMGEVDSETVVKDYKKVGDVLMPHTTVAKAAGQTMVMTFSEIAWNLDIPKGTFDMPAEVKALVK